MTWFVVIVLVAGGWAIWNLAKIAKGFKASQPVPQQPPCAHCPAENPAYLELDRKGYDKYHRAFDSLDEAIEKNPKAAWKKLEWMVPISPNGDHEILASSVAECFYGLSEGKTPTDILKMYDKLRASGTVIEFAERHGALAAMGSTFSESLDDYPEVKTTAELHKAIAFIRTDHPLMKAAVKKEAYHITDFLDLAAESVFDGWEIGKNSGEHYDDLEKIIATIEAKL